MGLTSIAGFVDGIHNLHLADRNVSDILLQLKSIIFEIDHAFRTLRLT